MHRNANTRTRTLAIVRRSRLEARVTNCIALGFILGGLLVLVCL